MGACYSGIPKSHRAGSEPARAASLQRTGVVPALEAGCRRAGARSGGSPALLGCDRTHMAGLCLRRSVAIRGRGKTVRRSVSAHTREKIVYLWEVGGGKRTRHNKEK